MIGEAKAHDVSIVLGKLEGRSMFREGRDIHLKEIDGELAIDVVKLIFVPTEILIQICRINLFKVAQVVGALRVHTFVNDEMFAFLLLKQRETAVRTTEVQGREAIVVIWREPGIADFTEQLAFRTVVLIEIDRRRFTARTRTILGNIAVFPAGDRFDEFTITLLPVRDQIFIGPILSIRLDKGEFIDLELLVFRRMGIIKGPLFERDKSADKADQPAILLIKVLAKLKKVKYNVHEHWILSWGCGFGE